MEVSDEFIICIRRDDERAGKKSIIVISLTDVRDELLRTFTSSCTGLTNKTSKSKTSKSESERESERKGSNNRTNLVILQNKFRRLHHEVIMLVFLKGHNSVGILPYRVVHY